ncbi:MAG: hypothetical protein M0006_03615 [Magnetospirillum sp.]|nr:hypothetical protein [Magnetospirillum sp.]
MPLYVALLVSLSLTVLVPACSDDLPPPQTTAVQRIPQAPGSPENGTPRGPVREIVPATPGVVPSALP